MYPKTGGFRLWFSIKEDVELSPNLPSLLGTFSKDKTIYVEGWEWYHEKCAIISKYRVNNHTMNRIINKAV